MSEGIYIAGKGGKDGALVKTCQMVFRWTGDGKVIVVFWHGDWSDDEAFWIQVASVMKTARKGDRTLITFFSSSIDEMRKQKGGDRLPLLFRLLGRDPDSRRGCCQITDFQRLGNAPLLYDPEAHETKRILKSNQILGLIANE
ncbi:MAG: hypothetical protein AAF491_01620 [Verrucomicrobiota bacterium]